MTDDKNSKENKTDTLETPEKADAVITDSLESEDSNAVIVEPEGEMPVIQPEQDVLLPEDKLPIPAEVVAAAVVLTPAELELQETKAQAVKLGITFHPSSGAKSLQAKINDYFDALPPEEESKPAEPVKPKRKRILKTDYQLKMEQNTALRNIANKLVRVNITCMNPQKSEWPGAILSVSNKIIGTIKKFVPFGTENGFHIPNALLIQMKDAKFQAFKMVKLENGRKQKKGYQMKEFAIDYLDPLTEQGLKDLANQQAMGHNID